jgi:hypothetical protein
VAGLSIVSQWGGRASESHFLVLFPSDCRICGTPLVTISRLPEPSPGGLRLLEGVLEPKPDTCPQTGLTSHRRRENMLGAFTVGRPAEVKGRPLVVVDDVYTTGTKVSECARVPAPHAASKVWVAAVARTLKVSVREVEVVRGEEGDQRGCPVGASRQRLSSEVLGGHSSRGMLSGCPKLSIDALRRALRRADAYVEYSAN